jgi:hypothetical protein
MFPRSWDVFFAGQKALAGDPLSAKSFEKNKGFGNIEN